MSDLGVGNQVELIGLQPPLEFREPCLDGRLGEQALEFVIDGVRNRTRHGTHGANDIRSRLASIPSVQPRFGRFQSLEAQAGKSQLTTPDVVQVSTTSSGNYRVATELLSVQDSTGARGSAVAPSTPGWTAMQTPMADEISVRVRPRSNLSR